MKIVGGPRNGQVITLAESQGGSDIQVPGMVLEYIFAHGHLHIKLFIDLGPKPSVPGLLERYNYQVAAWHYIAPAATNGFMASPLVVTE